MDRYIRSSLSCPLYRGRRVGGVLAIFMARLLRESGGRRHFRRPVPMIHLCPKGLLHYPGPKPRRLCLHVEIRSTLVGQTPER